MESAEIARKVDFCQKQARFETLDRVCLHFLHQSSSAKVDLFQFSVAGRLSKLVKAASKSAKSFFGSLKIFLGREWRPGRIQAHRRGQLYRAVSCRSRRGAASAAVSASKVKGEQ